jgi:hypothetical protein
MAPLYVAESPPVDARFTAFVARRLGMEAEQAAALLAHTRERLGPRAFAVRAAAFTTALRLPALPRPVRRRAIVAFVGPLLEHPAALNAYGAERAWSPGEPCAGLTRNG